MRRRAADAKPYEGMRMAALAERSGVARETIHFYLREGLLPRPQKGGRTVAYYTDEHLERLRLIRHLREEKYLPIAVIRRLLESPAGERDLDALADVLHIIPAGDDHGPPPSPEALVVAREHGLFGPLHTGGKEVFDPAELRVLRVIEETLSLDDDTRRLTLADLAACTSSLTELVSREAALFFDTMLRRGDVGSAIRSLRGGRPPVARFIAAYRDLLLQRIVEEVLFALEHGPEAVIRTATVPLSPRREGDLGVPARRASLREGLRAAEGPASASALVWHLFQTGAVQDLATLPPEVTAHLPARLRPLVAWGANMAAHSEATLQALAEASLAVPDFALGQILHGEAVVARGLRRKLGGASLLEVGIPALNRVFFADPDRDFEAPARAFGWFHRGRLSLALPPVLGRREDGITSLTRVLLVLDSEAPRLEAAARVCLSMNARLWLARYYLTTGEPARARELLGEATAMDPDGPIVQAAGAAAQEPERGSAFLAHPSPRV